MIAICLLDHFFCMLITALPCSSMETIAHLSPTHWSHGVARSARASAKTIGNIERSGDSVALSPETMAFRSNIMDRWVNSSIQDFELAERAALLQIDLNAREYQALVAVPARCCSIDERLPIQSYFNRLFKKEYGVTPAEYRRAAVLPTTAKASTR